MRLNSYSASVKILNYEWIINKGVFSPKYFFSTEWFAKSLNDLIKKDEKFLEIGCGSGIISVYLKLKQKERNIFCSDISKAAFANAKINAKKQNVKIKVFCGDVFEKVSEKNFDTIFWSMPFGYLSLKTKLKDLDLMVFDPEYKSINKFILQSEKYLKKNGRLLIGFSESLGDFNLLKKILKENNYKFICMREIINKELDSPVDMKILEAKKKK